MNTKFKDVAHLYLGCDMYTKFDDGSSGKQELTTYELSGIINNWKGIRIRPIEIKPILRPLSDITDEEFSVYYNMLEKCDYEAYIEISDSGEKKIGCEWPAGVSGVYINSQVGKDLMNTFLYLQSRSFDLFGLIESGEALDKTKLQ